MIDDVDAVGDSTEVFSLNIPCTIHLWNRREVTVLDSAHKNIPTFFFQFPPQDQPFPYAVEQLVLDDDEQPEFTFAPCALLSEQLTFDNSLQPAQIDLTRFSIEYGMESRKALEKWLKPHKKALEKVAHGTKKSRTQR